jgi:hypothetical protein
VLLSRIHWDPSASWATVAAGKDVHEAVGEIPHAPRYFHYTSGHVEVEVVLVEVQEMDRLEDVVSHNRWVELAMLRMVSAGRCSESAAPVVVQEMVHPPELVGRNHFEPPQDQEHPRRVLKRIRTSLMPSS